MPITLRLATKDDLETLLELWRGLEDHQREHRVFPTIQDPEGSITRVFDAMLSGEPDARVLLAEDAGTAVGMACLAIKRQGPGSLSVATVVELSRVIVLPSHRGTGVARELVAHARAFGTESGAEYMSAKVFSGNEDGVRFWESLGFVSRYEERVLRL